MSYGAVTVVVRAPPGIKAKEIDRTRYKRHDVAIEDGAGCIEQGASTLNWLGSQIRFGLVENAVRKNG
ncbi:hypothetical protein AA0311_0836 [Asaia bogorensis NBRC 16594]|nr:hypothetical protein AA0311_0836 [Asaia bogorensis NBRC 16594]